MSKPSEREAAGPVSSAENQEPPLFQPFRLRGVTLKNRIFVTPMCQYAAEDGHAVVWHFSHHGRFSLSGVGGAMVEATAITRDGRITPGCLGIYLDSHVEGLSRIVQIYHDQHIPVGIQIGHAGRKASAAVPLQGAAPLLLNESDEAWQAVAPSAIPLTDGWPTPRELSATEIESFLEAFALAALRACKAGFDFIEIHGAHGYLVNSFFSPISNKRSDHWGGSTLQNRMRFPLRIAESIRAVIPKNMPLFFRTSCVDGIDGGVTISETIALVRELGQRGVDLIDCSSGGIIGPSGRALQRPSAGYLVPFADQIRRETGIPTMAVGLITDAHQANEIIANGSADLVAMGRKLLDDPNFPYHAAQALGHSLPTSVLPDSYGFFLQRWKPD